MGSVARKFGGAVPRHHTVQQSRTTSAVGHGRYVTFQLAKEAVPREPFRTIPSLIGDLRPRTAPAEAANIDGEVKTTGGVCLNGGKFGQMAFQTRADLQNQAIGWLRK
jgi:hypothetical protein